MFDFGLYTQVSDSGPHGFLLGGCLYSFTFTLYRYVVSFILDSTIGLFVVYLGLKVTQLIVRNKKIESLYFGEYGRCLFVTLSGHEKFYCHMKGAEL